MAVEQPIYLHFFDRELWESVKAVPDREIIGRSLRVLLLGCDEPLYCGLSLLWENPALRDSRTSINRFILRLVDCQAIEAISQYPTVDEFVETRRDLYSHDRPRYPLYYKVRKLGGWPGPKATSVKTSSATKDLAALLDDWARGGAEQMFGGREAPLNLRRAVRTAITDREDRAITFALFRPYLEASGLDLATAEFPVRRQISRGYTSHYMAHASGSIATGIGPLSYFDSLSKTFPDHDVELLEYLLSFCGMAEVIDSPFDQNELIWLQFAARRQRDLFFQQACRNLKLILRTLYRFAVDEQKSELHTRGDLFGVRTAIKLLMRNCLQGEFSPQETLKNDFVSRLSIKSAILLRSVQGNRNLGRAFEMVGRDFTDKVPRLLVATATTIERDTVLRMAKQFTGVDALPEFGSRRSYYRLGHIGGVDLVLVQSEMGAVNPGASLSTLSDAIDDIKPIGVIMVGIAFGIDEKRQEIGQIIIARELQNYEIARIGTGDRGQRVITPRGYRVNASSVMVSRLRVAEVGWTGRKVKFGLLLTGEKLVDNIDFREEIRAISPEADGGEMEGGGLYTAAVERKVDWVVVKAICDWADGNKRKNKKQRQEIAATEAVGFVLRAVQQGGFQTMNSSGPSSLI